MTLRRPAVRAGVFLLISVGLWAGAGCASRGPAGHSEAEPPAPAHCAPLSGDPLPSMCSPSGRASAAAVTGRLRGGDRWVPSSAGEAGSGLPDTAYVRGGHPGDATAGDAAEPVSPELMPEAPFSGWGLIGPWLPDPGPTQPAEAPATVIDQHPGGAEEPSAVEDPIVVAPVAVDPNAVDPVAVDPVAVDPNAEDPTTEHPLAQHPANEHSAAEAPAATDLAATGPAATDPFVVNAAVVAETVGEPVLDA